jgi:predicted permease
MSLLDGLRHRLRVFVQQRSYDREIDEELRFHLSLEAMQQQHAGRGILSPQDARDRARRRFGNPTYHKEETRHMSGLDFVDMARQDVRFALRTLRRTPGFTAVAILTLALGIGANTAIFSAVDAMLLRQLPYREPDRLMLVSLTVAARHGEPAHDNDWSYLKANAFRDAQRDYTDLALSSGESVTLRLGQATREHAEVVDEHYLPTLGIHPFLGRNFLSDENLPNGKRSVLVSYAFWQGRLNADPTVLGRTLDIEGAPYTVIGVMPTGFRGLTGQGDFWMTIGARRPYMFEPNEAWDHEFTMVARLAPGISARRARSDAALLGTRVNYAFPSDGTPGWGATARPLDGARVDPIVRRSLLVLLGAVGFVLLVACANLANLFLVRASTRQREIAVRLAIGASRRRLVRQLLTESVVLSTLGAVASVGVAWWGAHLLSTLSPERALGPHRLAGLGAVNFSTIRLDWRGLAFAGTVAVMTGLLFGLVPALQATRPSLTDALKEGSAEPPVRGGLFRRLTTRNCLVVLELALALVLLAGSGVMIRSFAKLTGVDPGFDARRVLTLRMNSPAHGNATDSLPALYQSLLASLRALPGVESVALGDCPPLAGGCNSTVIWLGGRAKEITGKEPQIGVHWVTPDWFKVMRVPLFAGRVFTDADGRGARKALLVNATAARRLWPNESPIGKIVGIGMGGFDTAYVVGVVGDVRFHTIDSVPAFDAYVSYYQAPRPSAIVYLRTVADPTTLARPARSLIGDLVPAAPVYDVRTLASRVDDASAQAQFSSVLLALFAASALVLAAVGVYGVVAFGVKQRTREIGIRVALGAEQSEVLRLIVRQGVRLALTGVGLGLLAAFAATRALGALLFDVAPSDPLTFGIVAALLGLAALTASWIPARRAARLDPSTALRD